MDLTVGRESQSWGGDDELSHFLFGSLGATQIRWPDDLAYVEVFNNDEANSAFALTDPSARLPSRRSIPPVGRPLANNAVERLIRRSTGLPAQR